MIKAVLFDCDGTLFDTSFPIFVGYKYLFDKYRPDYKPSAEEYYSFLGPSLYKMFPKYFTGDLDTLVDEYRKAGEGYMDKEHIVAYPNLLECLEILKSKGIRLAIISSRAHFSIINVLKIYDLDKVFDVVIGCDDVTNPKPDPESFKLCLEKLNLNEDEVVMIGDHIGDIQGAINTNIKSIAVEWTTYGVENLIKLGADKVLKDYKDLPSLLEDF